LKSSRMADVSTFLSREANSSVLGAANGSDMVRWSGLVLTKV